MKIRSDPQRRISYERKKAIAGFLFITPWILGCVMFFIRPVISSAIYSFNDMEFVPGGIQYEPVGFEQYRYALFSDPDFVQQLAGSMGELLVNVPLIIFFSMFVAYLLNRKFRGSGFSKTVFFLPVIIATGVIIEIVTGSNVSQNMMSGGEASSSLFQVTVLQDILSQTGYSQDIVNFITRTVNNIFEVAWKSGIQILLFLAGYQAISPSVYEACQMEGATAWETFWKVTFPMVSPTLLLNVIYTLIDYFSDYSSPVIRSIYQLTTELNVSYSAAQSWIYFILIFIVVGIFYVLINRRVFYIVE